MAAPQQQVLQTLSSLGVAFEQVEHPAADSPNAQAAALDKDSGAPTHTWIVKDKANRLYMITALLGTKLDCKALSARLGLGKAIVQVLSHEEILHFLPGQPPLLSPLSLIQPEASRISLILDQRLQTQVAVLVPSLLNTCSIRLSPTALSSIAESLKRVAEYVDLEAQPKITREQPPDLKAIADKTEPYPASDKDAGPPNAKPAIPAKTVKQANPKAAKKPPVSAKQPQSTGMDLQHHELLNKIAEVLVGVSLQNAKLDPFVVRRLLSDVEMQLNGLRNNAYASGFAAGRLSVQAGSSSL